MKKYSILILALLVIFIGCQSRTYEFFAFSFPPKSVPHEKGWEYFGKIVIWNEPGKSFSDNCQKKIVITVEDTEKQVLLKDEFNIISGRIERKIKWDDFEELTIILNGEPDQSIHLKYRYNKKSKRFMKIQT
ncbi:MAG: hypothetical protein JRJ65_19705 [Deltaproteobacteria bacterium]|nr:hypothetical protein [Deltaproteobacteria bacterium]